MDITTTISAVELPTLAQMKEMIEKQDNKLLKMYHGCLVEQDVVMNIDAWDGTLLAMLDSIFEDHYQPSPKTIDALFCFDSLQARKKHSEYLADMIEAMEQHQGNDPTSIPPELFI